LLGVRELRLAVQLVRPTEETLTRRLCTSLLLCDFVKRWLRRGAVALVALVVALTVGSLLYNVATAGRDVPASKRYAGPYTFVDGTRLAYRKWALAARLSSLWAGSSSLRGSGHAVGPLLARRHRVYALDLPPFGYSQRRGPFTLAHWSQLVEGFDRRLGIRKPVLVGHSLGAAVAVSVAAEAPDAVAGIVLLDGDALPQGLQGAWGAGTPPFTAAFIDEWQRPFRVSGTAAAFASMLGKRHSGCLGLGAFSSPRDDACRMGQPRHRRLGLRGPAHRRADARALRRALRRRASLDARSSGLVANAVERVAHRHPGLGLTFKRGSAG
jgi:pimeloyl-ACP methyl ester carboxylesterase